MKILVNDVVQYSDAPYNLKSPSLAEKWIGQTVTITLDQEYSIDCFGIGYTDATELTINSQTIQLDADRYNRNGLYSINSIQSDTIAIEHNGTYIGRLGIGKSRNIGLSQSREPGFWSTQKSRLTTSGQTVPGAGGVSGRKIDVDVRYKIERDFFLDLQIAYATQIGCDYPLFMSFEKEEHRFPWKRLYAATDKDMLFQSSVNFFLYSKRFTFEERF